MNKNQSLFIKIIHMNKVTFPYLSFQLFQLWTFHQVDFAVWNKFLFEHFPPTGKFPDWKLLLCYCLGASCSLPTLPWHFQKQRANSLPVILIQLGMNLVLLQHWSTWPDSSFQFAWYQFTEAENNESTFSKHNVQIQCLSQESIVFIHRRLCPFVGRIFVGGL